MTTTPAEPPAISHQEVAGNHDTTGDSFVAPGGVTDQHVVLEAAEQVEVLTTFLENNFPGEMQRTNRQMPEAPVETAMRLLLGLSGKANLTAVTRCGKDFCNKNEGHGGVHGWVHRE